MNAGRFESLRMPLAFLALLCGLVLLTQFPSGADARGGGKGKARVAVKIETKSQKQLLKKGELAVALKARNAGKVKVTAAYEGRRRLFQSETVRTGKRLRRNRRPRPHRRRREAPRQLRRQGDQGAGPLPLAWQQAQGRRHPRSSRRTRAAARALHPGPGRERRPLRLPRPGGLPAAVPERLLHRGRPLDGDRQATEPEHRLDAGEHGRSPHGPDRHQPRRRVQPGQPDHGQDPRRRHAGGVPELGLRRPERPARLRRRRPTGDRDQRRHRRAPARLGRARLEPDLGRPERCRPRRHRCRPR